MSAVRVLGCLDIEGLQAPTPPSFLSAAAWLHQLGSVVVPSAPAQPAEPPTAPRLPPRYPKYNVTAKKLYRRLEALGACMLLPVGARLAAAPSWALPARAGCVTGTADA